MTPKKNIINQSVESPSLFDDANCGGGHSASAQQIDPYAYSNLRSDKYNSKESLKTLSRLKKVISVARLPYKLKKHYEQEMSP